VQATVRRQAERYDDVDGFAVGSDHPCFGLEHLASFVDGQNAVVEALVCLGEKIAQSLEEGLFGRHPHHFQRRLVDVRDLHEPPRRDDESRVRLQKGSQISDATRAHGVDGGRDRREIMFPDGDGERIEYALMASAFVDDAGVHDLSVKYHSGRHRVSAETDNHSNNCI
jgi:hypothetical protein